MTAPTCPTDPRVFSALAARERLGNAFRTGDLDTLTDLLAEDLVVNAPINRVVDRRDLLDRIQRGEAHQADRSTTTSIEYAERRAGVVVIMGEEVIAATDDAPTSPPIRRRFTDIWQPHGDSWQLTICQITVVPT